MRVHLAGLGQPFATTRGELPDLVVLTVTEADGDALKMAAAEGPAEVTLHAEVDTGWRQTPILVAEFAPPGAAAIIPSCCSRAITTLASRGDDNGSANVATIEVAASSPRSRRNGGGACASASGPAIPRTLFRLGLVMRIIISPNWRRAGRRPRQCRQRRRHQCRAVVGRRIGRRLFDSGRRRHPGRKRPGAFRQAQGAFGG